MSILVRKIGQTVFPEIAPVSIWFTLIAVAVCLGRDLGGWNLEVSTVMLSILSTMLSFTISLRTSSALERWNAGRQAWTTMSLASRNLASLIWIQIGPTTLSAAEQANLTPGSDEEEVEKVKGLIEKRTMLGLIQAFSVATKHYVRGESGAFYEDLYPLVSFLPKYSFPSGIEDPSGLGRDALTGLWRSPMPDGSYVIPVTATSSATPLLGASMHTQTSTTSSGDIDLEKGNVGDEVGVLDKDGKKRKVTLLPGYNPPEKGVYHYAPVFLMFKPLLKLFQRKPKRVKHVQSTNIPLEIHLFLNSYVAACLKRGTLPVPFVSIAMGYLNQLAESLATMERVLSTPLPFED
ncbi:hypothetical protein JCM8097_000863 [Rhodosporidiobolus ruineniae]